MKQVITFGCGHTCKVEVDGRNRNFRAQQIYAMEHGICPECAEKENAERAREAAAAAAAKSLPALTGSEKQIAWAEQLRMAFVNDIDSRFEHAEGTVSNMTDPTEIARNRETLDGLKAAYQYTVNTKTSANWWIDMRAGTPYLTLRRMHQEYKDQLTVSDLANAEASEPAAKDEATVAPESRTHEGAVEIRLADDTVTAHYIKDEDFREIVKALKYKWDSGNRCWYRPIDAFTGTAEDRAAELGNHLLRAGFAVTIWDEATRQKAVSAEYEPECDRWIKLCTRGDYADWFAISFPRGAQDLYDSARAIKGSRWSNPNVVVPAEKWREVVDFAECLNFSLSAGALAKIEEMRNTQYSKVRPAAPEVAEQPDKLKEILQSDDTVIADLKDD